MNEEELLKRSAAERDRIFSCYDRGREGAEIDPWEDPGYEVYHTTDRYGFIHDKRLPQKPDSYQIKLHHVEMERLKKWEKMTKQWDSASTKEKLRRRIYKGIPNRFRGQVWTLLLGIKNLKKEQAGKYEEMLQLARQWSTEIRQIDADVARQYRDHINYRERYSIKQKSMFYVLAAYSMYNMETPVSLGLRIWDIFLLDGDRILPAMAYTVMKLHKRYLIPMESLDEFCNYLQIKLEKDFCFDDDAVISTMERSMDELKRAKLDYPGVPLPHELPRFPFGTFKEPSFTNKVGRRSEEFSEAQHVMRESVAQRRDMALINDGRESTTPVEPTSGLGGSKFSFDPSLDDGTSPNGSRRSLAETSVTSTADLSVFSSATRSQALDNSLDTQSNISNASSGSGGLPTPRATPHQPSPDVVRIYVPYTSPASAAVSYKDDLPRTLPRSLDTNKIRIRVDPDQTPIVENLKPFSLESPDVELDLK
ncbi:usp6 n-terminal-like protein [Lasius niger]|uniref:Usp6 n-terminal-like protein n=1 Tax=Lasius niger TaxID=67767 RepID=A0A0J7NWV9_LASNI|nr:usp6 n-terminal-like protein [Lasius niger]